MNLSDSYKVMLQRREIDKNGCWIWLGCINDRGYGQKDVNGKRLYTHRISYIINKGPIKAALDHLCRNVRGANKHKWIHENKYYKSDGKHMCLPCSRERALARVRRLRAEQR